MLRKRKRTEIYMHKPRGEPTRHHLIAEQTPSCDPNKPSETKLYLDSTNDNDRAAINQMFWRLFQQKNLRCVLSLAQMLADRQKIPYREKDIRELGFANPMPVPKEPVLSIPEYLPIGDISTVSFDATGVDRFGRSCLLHWSDAAKRTNKNIMKTTFRLLQRSGGVTLAAALAPLHKGSLSLNAFRMALRFDRVHFLLQEPQLHPGWSIIDSSGCTPLLYNLLHYRSCVNPWRIVEVMTDTALNAVRASLFSDGSKATTTLLYFAVKNKWHITLRALLSRSSLTLHPLNKIQKEIQSFDAKDQCAIMRIFQQADEKFSTVRTLIQEAFYEGFGLVMDRPVAKIVGDSYRLAFAPQLAASANAKEP